jgi:type IV pilus assembly protein PilA
MRSVTCANCGLVGWADGDCCKRCGRPFQLNQQPPRPAPPPQDYAAGYDYGSGYDYAPAREQFGAQEKKRKGHAVASLVIGILGFFTFGVLLVGSIVGMILGVVALKKENSAPAVYGGKGVAIAGIVMNIIAMCMIVPIGIISAIAIPNLLASRRAANEASAISSLRVIMNAEATYQSTLGVGKFGSMSQLTAGRLVDGELSSGQRHGYVFNITTDGEDFEATATPATPSHGNRSFYISSSDGGEIHFATGGRPASASDPTLASVHDSQPRLTVAQPGLQSPAMAPAY